MGNVDSKYRKEEDSLRIDDLPVEVLVKIISYLNTMEKIDIFSMVNKRWFDIASNEIEVLPIKWPQEKSQFNFWKCVSGQHLNICREIQNLIVRFPRLKNLELATKITNKDMILPLESFLDSFGFDGTMEFDVSPDLIQTKNPATFITRIKINPKKENDFEYKEYQIVSLDILYIGNQHDSVIEEILSLSKIRYADYVRNQQEYLNFVKTIESLLSRPNLKQIVFDVRLFKTLAMDIEEEFQKNCSVEEITLFHDYNKLDKFWNKLFNALPNIKIAKVAIQEDFENLPVILKNISVLKHLKSLHLSIYRRFDAQRFGPPFGHILDICCEIIKNNFSMNSEVVIADLSPTAYWSYYDQRPTFEYLLRDDDSTNLIKKQKGENPKIVHGLSQ